MKLHHLPTGRGPFGRATGRLALLTALPVLLIIGRVAYTGRLTYAWLIWNLFLAWLPLLFAYLAVRPKATAWPVRLGFGAAWLLFLPNSPYLITDLIHLQYRGIPLLYDALMLFTSGTAGLALFLVSLRWMETAVAGWLGAWPGRAFGLATLAATGFGIYLGRYLRLNSWDLIVRPVSVARDILPYMIHPVQHWEAWAVTVLFAVLLLFAYGLLSVGPVVVRQEER